MPGPFDDLLSDVQEGPAPPPMGNPIGRLTSYGYASDPYGDSASLGRGKYLHPTGAWDNALRPSSFAASPDVERYLRAQGVGPMQPASLVYDDGSREVATWDDRTMQDRGAIRKFGRPLTGRIDRFSPNGVSPMDGRSVVRIERATAVDQKGPYDDLLNDVVDAPLQPPSSGGPFDDLLSDIQDGPAPASQIAPPSLASPTDAASRTIQAVPKAPDFVPPKLVSVPATVTPAPDAGFFTTALATARDNLWTQAAGVPDAIATVTNSTTRKAFDPSRQAELDAVWRESDELNDLARSGEGVELPQAMSGRLLALNKRATELSNDPGMRNLATEARQYGKRSYSDYGVDPTSTSLESQAGRAAGSFAVAAPTLSAGLIPGTAAMVSGAYQHVIANGGTEEEAETAARHTVAALPAFMLAGQAGGAAASKMAGEGASVLAKTLAGTAGAMGGNVVADSAINAVEKGDIRAAIPDMERLTTAGLFSLWHGKGVYDEATRSAAAQEISRRGEELPPPPADTTPPVDQIGAPGNRAPISTPSQLEPTITERVSPTQQQADEASGFTDWLKKNRPSLLSATSELSPERARAVVDQLRARYENQGGAAVVPSLESYPEAPNQSTTTARSPEAAPVSKEVHTGAVASAFGRISQNVRDVLVDRLTRVLAKNGTLKLEDIPSDVQSDMGMFNAGSMRYMLENHPNEAVSLLSGKSSASPSRVTETPFDPSIVSIPEGATSYKVQSGKTTGTVVEHEDRIELKDLISLEQGKGDATAVIESLKEKGKPIVLTVGQRTGDTPRAELEAFYGRRGFEPVEGQPGRMQWAPEAQQLDRPAYDYVQPKRLQNRPEGEREEVVTLKIPEADKAWEQNQGYIPPGGGGAEIPGRRAGFEEWLKGEDENQPPRAQRIETPEVSLGENGQLDFTNGRHRFSVLRDQGEQAIKVSMEPESAARARAAGLTVEPDSVTTAGPERQPQPSQEPKAQAENQAPGRPSPERISSIKNAQTDIDRTAMALRPVGATAKRPWAQVESEARSMEASKSGAAERLATELAANPREVSDTESALLAIYWTREKAALAEVNRAIVHAHDSQDPETGHGLLQQREKLEEGLNKLGETLRDVGARAGRALAARKMFDPSEVSAEDMIVHYRAKAGGRPLSEEERATVTKLHEDIQKSHKAQEEQVARREEKGSQEAAQKEHHKNTYEVAKETATQPREAAFKRAREYLAKQAEEARKRLKNGGTTFSSGGLGDIGKLKDYAIIGASHLVDAAGKVVEFARWKVAMLREFGESITPHLQAIFDESKKLTREAVKRGLTPEEILGKVAGRMKDGAALSELRSYVSEMAKAIIRGGKTTLPEMLGELKTQLHQIDPSLTDREVRDLYSGYGGITRPNPEPVAVIARDLKAQSLKISQLEDLLNKEAAQRTGPQRDKPSDRVRELERQVKEALKLPDIKTTDPERELRTAIQAIEQRLKNQLKDLAEEFDLGRKINGRREPPTSERAEKLKALIEQVKESLKATRQIEGKTPDQIAEATIKRLQREEAEIKARMEADDFEARKKGTLLQRADVLHAQQQRDAAKAEYQQLQSIHEGFLKQREDAKIKQVEDSMAKLDARLKSGNLTDAAKPPGEMSVTREGLMAERKAIQDQLAQMRLEASKTAGTPEHARRLAGYKARLSEQMERLRKRIADGEIVTPIKPTKFVPDEEGDRIRAETQKLKNRYSTMVEKARMEQRAKWEKAFDAAAGYSRGIKLTRITTLAKLASYTLNGLLFKPVSELAGKGASMVPGLRRISALANVEGGGSLEALGGFYKGFIYGARHDLTAPLRQALAIISRGRLGDIHAESEIKTLYAKEGVHLDPRWWDIPQLMHEAEKNPLKRADFEYATKKLQRSYEAAGKNVNDPHVREEIRKQAYEFAERSVLMNKNRFADGLNGMFSRFEAPDKDTKRVPVGAKALAAFSRTQLPFNRVSSNHFVTLFNHVFGVQAGGIRAAIALYRGIENLHPKDANSIIRQIKQGAPSAALITLGLLQPAMFGGMDPRRKREPGEPGFGEISIGGHIIPRFVSLASAPLMAAQIGATIAHAYGSRVHAKDKETVGVMGALAAGAFGVAESGPIINEAARAGKLLEPGQRMGWVYDWLDSNAIPGILDEVARETDRKGDKKVKRSAQDWKEHFMESIPGMRQQVPVSARQ